MRLISAQMGLQANEHKKKKTEQMQEHKSKKKKKKKRHLTKECAWLAKVRARVDNSNGPTHRYLR